VEGIEFRSTTVLAYKGKQWECLEKNQAIIYKWPWKSVQDDDGHTFYRGDRMAVCEKTYKLMTKAPYGESIIWVEPLEKVKEIIGFDCSWTKVFRSPKETKSWVKRENTYGTGDNCSTGSCC
jgi:hypothetical protein